jgi:ABC-type nickel/cobalt efflux system permease component RcnA
MSALLKAVAENPTAAGGSLLMVSFIYGVLHALGPGHGKVVITTWLATHPSKLKSSIGLTLASSLLQGLVAVRWWWCFRCWHSGSSAALSSFWLEKGSYALVGVGLLLCWRALKKLRGCYANRRLPPLRRITFIMNTAAAGISICPRRNSCSGDDWRARLMIILSMGMRPCSGAIMVLLFSKVIGVLAGEWRRRWRWRQTSLTISSLACWCTVSVSWR